MKRNWYKFRVKYSKVMDDGKKKKVSEEYLVDAESFTETEKRANKAATDLIGTRDFDITAISREAVSDIIKGTEAEDNHWYKAVVALVTEDDETGQKKFSPQIMYVNAEDTKEADKMLREHMDDSQVDWEIKSIAETKVNQQEKNAAERQVELLVNAFDKAQENGGVWLNKDGKKAPQFYLKGVTVSPFNAIILGLHSDQSNYKTNEYTLFTEAKKRGESVQSGQKGVPFYWYNWNEYQSKADPEVKISRDEYKALTPEQQSDYKGIRNREVRMLFNIEQTTLPMVDKEAFDKEVKERGRLSDRGEIKATSSEISINDFILKTRDNLVAIRLDTTGVAHYDAQKDTAYVPKRDITTIM